MRDKKGRFTPTNQISRIAETARYYRSYALVIERLVRLKFAPGARQKSADSILYEVIKREACNG